MSKTADEKPAKADETSSPERRGRAADATSTAKRCAKNVRRCAAQLTEALMEANTAGLTVQLFIGQLDLEEQSDADVVANDAQDVRVGDIQASVSL